MLQLRMFNLTINDAQAIERDIAYGTNVLRHKYSTYPNFIQKLTFLKSCKKFLHS